MADKKYNLAFALSDGTTKNVQFSVPHVEVGKDVPSYDEHKNVTEQIADHDRLILANRDRSVDNRSRIIITDRRITITEKRITNLEKGVAADSFEVDDSVAYAKSVPANSAPYAAISKVGGMTHRVNVGTEDAPVYELRHAAVTEFASEGSNLLRVQQRTATSNGITFVGNEDGTITVSGTATAHAYFDLVEINSLDGSESGYLCDGCPEGGSDAKYALQLYNTKADGSSGTLIFSEFGRGQPFTTAYKNFKAMIVVRSGTTVSNIVFKPRIIEQSKKDLPFRKAFCRTFPIPEAVQALGGYGWGIDGEYNNHIAYEEDRRTWNYRVVKKVFDGTENWYDSVAMGNARDTNYFRLKIGDLYYGVADLAVSNKYATANITVSNKALGVDIIQSTSSTAAFSGCNIGIRPEGFDALRVADFKALLAEWYAAGDPLVVYYVLTTPEVTDISDLLPADNLIEVEGGGTITFENEHGLAVPSEVIYQTKGAAV